MATLPLFNRHLEVNLLVFWVLISYLGASRVISVSSACPDTSSTNSIKLMSTAETVLLEFLETIM